MDSPRLNLLDEPLIRIRDPGGQTLRLSLPELFVALGEDAVRDYPALRPHQRHPWHALLVQLAALALHEASETRPWSDPAGWRAALLALTPEHPDGCAYCLIASHDKPAFLQAPVPGGKLDGWKDIPTPDALDMLVTSKNHDLKGERMRRAEADDWLFALVSLQTQDGYPGSGNFGISRMNKGSGSRPGVGVVSTGGVGKRWRRDTAALLAGRDSIVETHDLPPDGGLALVWLRPWSGKASEIIHFCSLDPFYVDICRRIRLTVETSGRLVGKRSTSEGRRIDADACKGRTGDAWTPVSEEKSLTLAPSGFNYSLMAELAWGARYRRTIAQGIRPEDGDSGISIMAQCVVRGQSKTEGYHERRIPLSKKIIGLMLKRETDALAHAASARVRAVAAMQKEVLKRSLFCLFEAGTSEIEFDRRTTKQQVEPLLQMFERAEDSRFFEDLNQEIEAVNKEAERLDWLIDLSKRAELVLRRAFAFGPRCGERRYRAQSRALAEFHRALRNEKHGDLLQLVHHLRSQPAAEEAAP